MKEQYKGIMEKLDQQLLIVEKGILESNYRSADNTWSRPEGDDKSYLLDASTPLDAIEMATRCISMNDRIEDLRANSDFKEAVIRRVMETVQRCGLNRDVKTMARAGKYHASAAEYFHETLKENGELALDIVEENPDIIRTMPEYFSAEYPETYLQAAERNPSILQNPEYMKYAKQAAEKYPDIFGKRFEKLQEGKDPRKGKIEKLAGLMDRDAELTAETQQVKDELGITGKEQEGQEEK